MNISGTTKSKNFRTIRDPAESTNLIFKKLKYNPISSETVPLSGYKNTVSQDPLNNLTHPVNFDFWH
jgi:hypothetical protein